MTAQLIQRLALQVYAEKCKVGWPRTSLALRRIEDYYEVQAKWQDEHAEARD